jgi:hypothetical protein
MNIYTILINLTMISILSELTQVFSLEADKPEDFITLHLVVSSGDPESIYRALIGLVKSNQPTELEFVRNAMSSPDSMKTLNQSDRMSLTIRFCTDVSSLPAGDELIKCLLSDENFTSNSKLADALLAGIARISPSDNSFVPAIIKYSKNEQRSLLSIPVLLSIGSDESCEASVTLLIKIESLQTIDNLVLNSFSSRQYVPCVIAEFRKLLSGKTYRDPLYQDILGIMCNLWTERWTQQLARINDSNGRDRFSAKALKEVILLENDVLNQNQLPSIQREITAQREKDISLFMDQASKETSKNLGCEGWNLRVTCSPPGP